MQYPRDRTLEAQRWTECPSVGIEMPTLRQIARALYLSLMRLSQSATDPRLLEIRGHQVGETQGCLTPERRFLPLAELGRWKSVIIEYSGGSRNEIEIMHNLGPRPIAGDHLSRHHTRPACGESALS